MIAASPQARTRWLFSGLVAAAALWLSVARAIANEGTAVHVVVLGSSTAEGTGASVPDSSWVGRYRNALLQLNPDHEVTNLALGGYTTWHVRPTGAPHPVDRPAPDPARNVTRALSLGADAIIINLPTNDVAAGYPIWEQITNDDLVRSVAAAASVPVWVTTSQPRNFSGAFLDSLKKLRDTTFVHYGRYAIDFWTDLATPSGTIVQAYDSGDGIHLNDAGHRILFERALAEDIHKIFLVGVADTPVAALEAMMSVTPQPVVNSAMVHFLVERPGDTVLLIYDLHGRVVDRAECGYRVTGRHQVSIDVHGLPDGLYFCQLRVGKDSVSGLVRLAIVH